MENKKKRNIKIKRREKIIILVLSFTQLEVMIDAVEW